MVEDGASLFDRVLVVSFTAASQKPEVTYMFPPPTQGKDSKDTVADSVSEFCYPESHSELIAKFNTSNYSSETFSFVLTDSLGGKTYGYCRRFRTDKELECFCILSHTPSFSLFSQILDIVESRRKVSTTLVYSFLKTVLAQIFPAPGETLSVKTFSVTKNDEMDVYNLTRPADEYLTSYVSFYNLFHWLDLEDILKVWEYLLCERRVVFCSKNLGTLSSFIYALCALLYPFMWQHIFIPILPQSLIHFITAPMPFLCGILSSSKSALNGFPLDEVIMLDLDHKEFTLDYPFERVLPIPQFCTLKNSLRKLLKSGKKDKEFDHDVAKYFLLFFNNIFRDYKKYITPAKPLPPVPVPAQEVKAPTSKKKPIKKRNPKGDFDRSAFMKSQNDESTQKFLELFGSSQMFETFILEREEMAVVGSATLPDCHFLTLCRESFHEHEYLGTVECERCAKGVTLKHSCTFESYHFHPHCFECKRCHSTLVYDDFSAVVVQVNSTTQDPASKVRMICASCEHAGGGPSAGASAASFLKRMKHAVAKKMDPTKPSSSKKDEDKTSEKVKPATPPPVMITPPPPQPAAPQVLPKPPQQDNKKTELPTTPAPPRRDSEGDKRASTALHGEPLTVQKDSTRQSAPPSKVHPLNFYKAQFKSMQLQREPEMACIKLEDFAPNSKRKSRSDIFPRNEKARHQSVQVSQDDNSLALMKEQEAKNSQTEAQPKHRQSLALEETAKPPSPKPLPTAPRPQRTRLVPPNPALLNLNPEGARSESRSAAGEISSDRPNQPTNSTQTTTSIQSTNPPATKPRSGSGATPRVNFVEPPAIKPRSGSFGRGLSTNPPGQSTNPSAGQPTSTLVSGKPRSGSVGRPSVAPSVNVPSASQTSSAPSSTSSSTRPRSGSVGRPVPVQEPPTSALMSQHRTPVGPNSHQPTSYKPNPPSKPLVKPKQLPIPPALTTPTRGEANNSRPTSPINNPTSKPANPINNNNTVRPTSPINNPNSKPANSINNNTNPRPTSPINDSNSKPTNPINSNSHTAGVINNITITNKTNPSPINVTISANKPKPSAAPTLAPSRPVPTLIPTGPKSAPVLTKSKSVPDASRISTNIVLDEPPSQKCALCKKSFASPSDPPDTPYRIVSTNDAYYHPACFVCSHCGKTIETAYVTRDRHAYHRECAANIAHICSVCNKPILSQYLEFLGKIIHKECFVCVSCKEPLAKIGSKYVELDGNSYCLNCTKNRPTTK